MQGMGGGEAAVQTWHPHSTRTNDGSLMWSSDSEESRESGLGNGRYSYDYERHSADGHNSNQHGYISACNVAASEGTQQVPSNPAGVYEAGRRHVLSDTESPLYDPRIQPPLTVRGTRFGGPEPLYDYEYTSGSSNKQKYMAESCGSYDVRQSARGSSPGTSTGTDQARVKQSVPDVGRRPSTIAPNPYPLSSSLPGGNAGASAAGGKYYENPKQISSYNTAAKANGNEKKADWRYFDTTNASETSSRQGPPPRPSAGGFIASDIQPQLPYDHSAMRAGFSNQDVSRQGKGASVAGDRTVLPAEYFGTGGDLYPEHQETKYLVLPPLYDPRALLPSSNQGAGTRLMNTSSTTNQEAANVDYNQVPGHTPGDWNNGGGRRGEGFNDPLAGIAIPSGSTHGQVPYEDTAVVHARQLQENEYRRLQHQRAAQSAAGPAANHRQAPGQTPEAYQKQAASQTSAANQGQPLGHFSATNQRQPPGQCAAPNESQAPGQYSATNQKQAPGQFATDIQRQPPGQYPASSQGPGQFSAANQRQPPGQVYREQMSSPQVDTTNDYAIARALAEADARASNGPPIRPLRSTDVGVYNSSHDPRGLPANGWINPIERQAPAAMQRTPTGDLIAGYQAREVPFQASGSEFAGGSAQAGGVYYNAAQGYEVGRRSPEHMHQTSGMEHAAAGVSQPSGQDGVERAKQHLANKEEPGTDRHLALVLEAEELGLGIGDMKVAEMEQVVRSRLGRLDSIPHTMRVNSAQLPNPDDSYRNHTILSERLHQFGLRERQIDGDGNCQFRALADQQYGTPEKHAQVRKDVKHQLKANAELYEAHVPENYQEYIKKMAKNGEWGDHITLQAAADCYQAKISLITSYKDKFLVEIVPRKGQPMRELWLSFWAEVHYNSIYAIEDFPRTELKEKKKHWLF